MIFLWFFLFCDLVCDFFAFFSSMCFFLIFWDIYCDFLNDLFIFDVIFLWFFWTCVCDLNQWFAPCMKNMRYTFGSIRFKCKTAFIAVYRVQGHREEVDVRTRTSCNYVLNAYYNNMGWEGQGENTNDNGTRIVKGSRAWGLV